MCFLETSAQGLLTKCQRCVYLQITDPVTHSHCSILNSNSHWLFELMMVLIYFISPQNLLAYKLSYIFHKRNLCLEFSNLIFIIRKIIV